MKDKTIYQLIDQEGEYIGLFLAPTGMNELFIQDKVSMFWEDEIDEADLLEFGIERIWAEELFLK